ncbi:MAG: hypothetical protein DRJ40_05905 [Thermoprotei archaeon]|nr:MAG: hypothetical protein DRJ40_05905 [Thermoprotei archaeon]
MSLSRSVLRRVLLSCDVPLKLVSNVLQFLSDGLEVVGRTRLGREILLARLGSGREKVVYVGGIFGDALSVATLLYAVYLLRYPVYSRYPLFVGNLLGCGEIAVIPVANPEGYVVSERQYCSRNAAGVDLVHDFLFLTQLETQVIHRVVNDLRPLALVFLIPSHVDAVRVTARCVVGCRDWVVEFLNDVMSFLGNVCDVLELPIELRKEVNLVKVPSDYLTHFTLEDVPTIAVELPIGSDDRGGVIEVASHVSLLLLRGLERSSTCRHEVPSRVVKLDFSCEEDVRRCTWFLRLHGIPFECNGCNVVVHVVHPFAEVLVNEDHVLNTELSKRGLPKLLLTELLPYLTAT